MKCKRREKEKESTKGRYEGGAEVRGKGRREKSAGASSYPQRNETMKQ